MKKVAKEVYEKNLHHHDTLKTITRVYLSNHECSVLEVRGNILPKLKLRRIFPAVPFLNTNFPVVSSITSSKITCKLSDDCIFKRSNIDRMLHLNIKYNILQWETQRFK